MIKIKILKEGKILQPFEDFLVELSWWQKRGIGTNLSKRHLKKHFDEALITEIHHSELEGVSNCYNRLIKGNTLEEKFESLFQEYLKDNRGPAEQRASSEEGKRQYLHNLMESVVNKSCPPSVVVEIKNLGKFMTGGRTRAALAKVADVPIHVRNIVLPEHSLIEREIAIKALKDTLIKEQ